LRLFLERILRGFLWHQVPLLPCCGGCKQSRSGFGGLEDSGESISGESGKSCGDEAGSQAALGSTGTTGSKPYPSPSSWLDSSPANFPRKPERSKESQAAWMGCANGVSNAPERDYGGILRKPTRRAQVDTARKRTSVPVDAKEVS
jgi:hypothetical protein